MKELNKMLEGDAHPICIGERGMPLVVVKFDSERVQGVLEDRLSEKDIGCTSNTGERTCLFLDPRR